MKLSNVSNSKVENLETHNGIDQKDRAALAEHLGKALADNYLLYLKTQNLHWNVVGPMFYGVHKLTEAQYQDMAEAIDDIAERIRAIGFPAPGNFEAYKKVTSIKEAPSEFDATAMIAELANDNETCSRSFRKAVSEAEKLDDVKTADLLTERIGQHEENTWMLRALVS